MFTLARDTLAFGGAGTTYHLPATTTVVFPGGQAEHPRFDKRIATRTDVGRFIRDPRRSRDMHTRRSAQLAMFRAVTHSSGTIRDALRDHTRA